ncbi:MAG: metallophosphoesterase [Clostridia bacterium]|nr:metallophosphoesterase [Clostridia bacterium]
MRYYAVADIHGYYTQLIEALKDKGFFEDKGPRKLVVCGDLFDRGREAKELQTFILDLMEKDEVILIRGNHEDLFMQLLDLDKGYPVHPHVRNGTYNTGLQLIESDDTKSILNPNSYVQGARKTPYVAKIIPSMLDYFETEHYIFVHGWIPCGNIGQVRYFEDWRNADKDIWEGARWLNGMQMWRECIREEGKTIVCGHFHTSFGHSRIRGKCAEYGEGADFSPFIDEGIIALDACTAHSGFVNCVVIDD